MTVDLDKLMALEGAIASSEFNRDGELLASKLDASQDCGDLIDMMIAARTFMRIIEQRLERKKSNRCKDLEFSPVKGLALSAGEYSICVMGDIGLLLETSKANFKGVFKALGREAGVV